MTTQRAIAKFIKTVDREWAKPSASRVREAFADTMACAIAGRNEPVTQQALAYVQPHHTAGDTDIWAAAGRALGENAALANAVAAHALDYDDVAPAFRGHPSAVLFPAILAVASSETKGRDIFDAYVVGFEVGARLGQAIIATHYPTGWHSTATIGLIGATAACARLLRVPEDQISHAIGLAASQAAGFQANFGTGAKPLQAGFASSSAVRSVRLAALGVTASDQALDDSKGFSGLYGNGADLSSAFRSLGDAAPDLIRSGIETKYLPVCYAAHRAIAAAKEIKRQHRLSANDVERIVVVGNVRSHDPLLKRLPQTADEAKFSIEFSLATLLIDGTVGLASFSEAALARADIRTLMSLIRVSEASKPSPQRWSEVTIVTRAGREFLQRIDALDAGSDVKLRAKIEDCLTFARLDDTASLLLTDLEKFQDMTVAAFFSGTAMSRVRGAKPLRAIA